jgi:hypothetical protein
LPYLVVGGATANAVFVVAHLGPWSLPLAALFVGAAAVMSRGEAEPSRPVLPAFILLTLATYGGALTLARPPLIDVHVFLTEGARALLHGQDPYSITYPYVYDPSHMADLYGVGVVQNGQITYGFPYPPLTLLAALPGYLLGDVRLSTLVALSALTFVLLRRSKTARARRAAVLLLCAPGVLPTLFGAWVEPISVALLGAVVIAHHARKYLIGAVALGLLLMSKQYFAAVLPCVWLLRPYATRARVLATLLTGIVCTVPFVLWNFADAWRGIVEFQFVQPFRTDSTSIPAVLVNHLQLDRPGWAGPVSLLLGLLVSIAAARWLTPGVTSFTVAIALSLGVLFLFSKQAFLNYYALCGCALLIAAWSRANDSDGHTAQSGEWGPHRTSRTTLKVTQ